MIEVDVASISAWADLYEADGLSQYELEQPGHGGMSPGQRELHESQHPRRLLIAGNQVGKTRALAAETWWLALGRHPSREVAAVPNVGWVMCADLKAGWANFSAKMREVEPPGVLEPSVAYDGARGYTYRSQKMLKLRNGSLIVGKSGSQEVMALAGATISYLVIDELPKQSHFSEALTRVAVSGGPCVMSFTPIGRPCDWLRHHCSGNPDTGEPPIQEWDIHRIKLTPENCPHRSAESIEKQIESYGPWEYAQRVNAAWEGVTTDRWISFSEDNLFTDPPKNVEAIGLGWDHGERPGASVCYLVAFDGSKLWVLDEYVSQERNTPQAEAMEILEILKSWGIKPTQIDKAIGDSNSAGRLGLGLKVNELLERAFAHCAGSSRPPFPIGVPYKGRGSVRTRARMLSSACVDGRFRVHAERCPGLVKSLRHWRGENNDLKHSYDAVSYIAEAFLDVDISAAGRMIFG